MKVSKFLFSITLSLILLTGCTGNGVYLKTDKSYAKTDFTKIKVYSSIKLTSEYEVLGYVSTYTSNAFRDGDLLKVNLRKQAAKYGANAIIGFKLNIAASGGGGAEGIAVRVTQ